MTQPIEPIATAYDQWSSSYETDENATRDLAARILRQQIVDLRARDVLEIGCGTGLNTRYLAAESRSVLGIDFSAGMLAQARAQVTAVNVRFARQDIRLVWEIASRSVDLVVCTLVLEHIEHLDPIFDEVTRVLRPGGEFFLCELHPFRQLQGRQARYTEPDAGETILVPAFLHDVSDFVMAGVRHGFTLLRLDEWRDGEIPEPKAIPRLLSMHVRL